MRRPEIYGTGEKTVISEDLPMIQCLKGGITYLEPQVIRMIDEISATPQKHASCKYRQVANIT